MTRQQQLEERCKSILGGATDIKSKMKRLADAHWIAFNSGYCDAMANKLMAGLADAETDYWLMVCSLKYDIRELYDIYAGMAE